MLIVLAPLLVSSAHAAPADPLADPSADLALPHPPLAAPTSDEASTPPPHGAAAEPAVDTDPLTLDPEALEWARSAAPRGAPRRRLADLATALVARGWREDDTLTLTAGEAFARGEGDCVSFALALTALARSRDVPAVLFVRDPDDSERTPGLEVARGHMAVGLAAEGGAGDGSAGDGTGPVYDAAGERPDGDAGFRRIGDRQAIGIFHANRGAALLLDRRVTEAIAALRRATEAAPGLATAWINLGVARRFAGDLTGAEEAYRRALALAPRSASAWRNLALLLEARLQLEQPP